MLKIKDNVDLKELERFGFKPKYNADTGEMVRLYSESKPIHCENLMSYTRFVYLYFYKNKNGDFILDNVFDVAREMRTDYLFNDCDLLYDLIKADLVEKVGDKENE